jgi:hypothetical protein
MQNVLYYHHTSDQLNYTLWIVYFGQVYVLTGRVDMLLCKYKYIICTQCYVMHYCVVVRWTIYCHRQYYGHGNITIAM